MEEDIRLGKYIHSKTGNPYELIAIAVHTETGEEMAVYKALYDNEDFGYGAVFVRPLKMFTEKVSLRGEVVERFKLIN